MTVITTDISPAERQAICRLTMIPIGVERLSTEEFDLVVHAKPHDHAVYPQVKPVWLPLAGAAATHLLHVSTSDKLESGEPLSLREREIVWERFRKSFLPPNPPVVLDFQIRNVRLWDGIEGLAYHCELFLNGHWSGYAVQQGYGGDTQFAWFAPEQAFLFACYIKGLPPLMEPEDLKVYPLGRDQTEDTVIFDKVFQSDALKVARSTIVPQNLQW